MQQNQQLILESLPSPDRVLSNSPRWQRRSASSPRTHQPHGPAPAQSEGRGCPHQIQLLTSDNFYLQTRQPLCVAMGTGPAPPGTRPISCGRSCAAEPRSLCPQPGTPPRRRNGTAAPAPLLHVILTVPAGGSGRGSPGEEPSPERGSRRSLTRHRRSAPGRPGEEGLPHTHLPCARPRRRSSCNA